MVNSPPAVHLDTIQGRVLLKIFNHLIPTWTSQSQMTNIKDMLRSDVVDVTNRTAKSAIEGFDNMCNTVCI